MKTNLLICTADTAYAEHLSRHLSERHADAFEVCVCLESGSLHDTIKSQTFDAALIDPGLSVGADLRPVRVPLLIWSEESDDAEASGEYKRVRKYQRISSIVAEILTSCAEMLSDARVEDLEKARVTVVWSPAGGVGKTTVALAYAAKKVADGKETLYLDMEHFSSVPVYFHEAGTSISSVFEMLENGSGNIQMLIRAIRKQDNGDGIAYISRPDNYDDMNILSAEDAATLLRACCGVAEEVVVDMPCVCDARTRKLFEIADKIFLVTDATAAARTKVSQFVTQHNVYGGIKAKLAVVANRGATVSDTPTPSPEIVALPHVASYNAQAVYRSLAAHF
jgi:MinD-like ATPase involved in chromosome partitioning or flagellar assembly